jgi:hypothetical protein
MYNTATPRFKKPIKIEILYNPRYGNKNKGNNKAANNHQM